MNGTTRTRGFTLIEVLVALALVATALGGTLAVLRQSISTQQYLERRLFAHWVADNVINQFMLENPTLEATRRTGEEVLLGRNYAFIIAVSPVVKKTDDKPKTGFEIAVEVRDSATRGAPLARAVRELIEEAGA